MRPQVEHAIADGHDVRSFLYWTLVDNFEVRAARPAAVRGARAVPYPNPELPPRSQPSHT